MLEGFYRYEAEYDSQDPLLQQKPWYTVSICMVLTRHGYSYACKDLFSQQKLYHIPRIYAVLYPGEAEYACLGTFLE